MHYMEKDPGREGERAHGPNPRRGWWIGAVALVVMVVMVGAFVVTAAYIQLERSLPSIQSLKEYRPPVVSRMYAADGTLIGEFYTERRYVRPLASFPRHVIQAFLAAEDARFYEHGGVDVAGIVRAMIKNVRAGQIVQGGSTITQQVVKSLLLSPERTYIRKIKEAILAYRIDRSMTKDEILHLYLNQIYLGSGAYGVEAAARTYFDKSASELTVAQAALLAGLPKAPSRYNPFRDLEKARERQHYVLDRMVEVGFLAPDEAEKARREPLDLAEPGASSVNVRNSFTEEVRRRVEAHLGRDALYRGGLSIHTTLDLDAQRAAEAAVRRGLEELDKRHGYRGPHGHVEGAQRDGLLKELEQRYGDLTAGAVVEAVVLDCRRGGSCRVSLGGDRNARLRAPAKEKWAARYFKSRKKALAPGDVIRVRLEGREGSTWNVRLEQEPAAEGAFLALDPRSGRVYCLVGGKDFSKSQFNRAIQAIRQPGSAFKPIIYAAALDRGFTAASVLIDSPIIEDDPSLQGPWKPANYDRKFWGPLLLRDALIHSRNVVTIKLLQQVGIEYVVDYAHRLGIRSPLTPTLSLALGASGVSLWELLTAYSAFANQGVRSEPYLVEAVYDRDGRLLEEHAPRQEAVISPQTAFLVTHILQGVIQEGTGRRVRRLGRPAAGKTGTTNDLKDAWFIGYTPSTLAGAWVGHDDHRLSLGRRETGGRAAAPIWLYFMEAWLKGKPVKNFSVPPGIVFAKVQPKAHFSKKAPKPVYMAFKEGTVPQRTEAAPSQLGVKESTSDSFFKSDLFWKD
ncbi:penicillin-binding protein 1A [Desulfacinum hydrothermale DSM 13146]|uniref:Penicillin-binding protein 1A n=1 Tax=Desulfacinum hydrothermale DSM 13146 TaxID=1121390 RepID=A0A1W1XIA2_9BACT|nr:PBP1A family penicillin-binding protein [Desulfacinum hydrothermale]SMC23699.1 penicillin-binding protein 1A [Desulfacinum hydrothermale DSM 13146]